MLSCAAGKSTTLSILTGLLDPDAGNAYLCGYSLRNELSSIFSVLGICPQQDHVYDDLSVRDHLLFYARLKGVKRSFESGLVQYIAMLTELDGDPLHKPASALSGGMRRRLSLGVSLIGNPRIWLLGPSSQAEMHAFAYD
jgi:ABC-type multidrug transport system ATPase subunit